MPRVVRRDLVAILLCVSCIHPVYFILVVLFFLFFKQKTAYEMRISDWSSDVCSSDLFALVHRAVAAVRTDVHALVAVGGLRPGASHAQIGRASCRERVCQYV